MTTSVGSDRIVCVFDVTYRLDLAQTKRQHVILLKDGSFICTCLLLQNNGIVCRHYFHLMQVDSRFKYHVKLIPRRWYKEHLQDSQDLEDSFGPFLCAMTQKSKISEDEISSAPGSMFMSDIFKIFPLPTSLSRDDQSQLSKKRRHGEISGRMKDIIAVVDSNPEMFDLVKEGLDQVIVKGRGAEGMKDPVQVKSKGRPKKKRITSSIESRPHSTRSVNASQHE